MAGTYWIGFKLDESPDKAIEAAIAMIREDGDDDAITAGPEVIDVNPGDDQLQIRIVTGIPDPRVEALAKAKAQDKADEEASALQRKLAALTPEHIKALDSLVALMREGG